MHRTLLLAGAMALVLALLAPILPALAVVAEPALHAPVEIPVGEVILWIGGLVVAVAAGRSHPLHAVLRRAMR